MSKRKRSGNRQTQRYRKDHANDCCCVCSSTSHITVDHIVPRALFGSNKKHNLMILCGSCNNNKGNTHPLNWYNELPLNQRTQELLDKVMNAIGLEFCGLFPKVTNFGVKIRGIEKVTLS